MLRDFKFLRRNPAKNEEPENIPANPKDLAAVHVSSDPSRPPLNSIQAPTHHHAYPEQDLSNSTKADNKTPSKAKGKACDAPALPLRTPEKHGGADFTAKNRFGWRRDSAGEDFGASAAQASCRNMTPRAPRTVGRATVPSFSECTSTQSTPTKSVSKPPSSIVRGKVDRVGAYGSLYKGSGTVVNSVEVPHFDLKEDPSFWMEHNVQVVIRIRPLNAMERSTNGYNRCLKQESAQNITWIGHPENRFRFDHVACETVDQEMLFRMACLPMVENCLSGYNSCMFAYGQTGSGKTYTMLGEIDNLEFKPSPHRGMTPRIFEFLFARIQAEEESRRDENLKYHCKCSFLEIYNEQITDLLDPSSTNLLIREDNNQGVYVENLSEFEVHTVGDILSLLTQGSANRKVAATNMNRESSRSHSVFTCVIESRWENDSTTNLRFARLNLVDLAGSERQKTSGAEGERLKEAANINKSLSTLGHVIMVLVDVAQGKQRHIPYRDSRLTFLLQDSLGGNSKTMIIANVSPSTGSAAETLNTLKFAQRAKMIQNNAVVNEDSTGDVLALQHQIRLLKEELMILKRQNVSRSLTFGFPTAEDGREKSENNFSGHVCDMDVEEDDDFLEIESRSSVRLSNKQLKCLETTLAGALRREQMAETSKKQLEAEIEQLDRLVRQREEDTRSSKMMLRFREDKIQRMESVVSGAISSESYLLEENRALSEEIQLLQAKLDRNPEVTRFAHENIRLLEQLRRYQEFYEEGEKEILLTEVSSLRNQLLQYLDGNSKQQDNPNFNLDSEELGQINKKNDSLQVELKKTCLELEECRRNLNSCLNENEKLSRELEDMRLVVMNLKCSPLDIADGLKVLSSVQIEEAETTHESVMTESAEEIVNLQLELDILKIIMKEERSSGVKMEERITCLKRELELSGEEVSSIRKHCDDAKKELEEAKSVIEALEAQQILMINETEDLVKTNDRQIKLLSKQELTIKSLREKIALRELKDASSSNNTESDASVLKEKVKRIQCSLENAKRLNTWYQNDRESQVNDDEEMDEVRRQAEAETAEVIVCLEEELAVLQQEVQDRHFKEVEMKNSLMTLEAELKEAHEKVTILTKDNQSIRGKLDEKDCEMKALSEEWSLLTSEIEEILADGHDSLAEMSDQLEHISSSFSQKRIWISENVGRMARAISEKELIIEELRRCLEDANNTRSDVESMLKSLRGAALAITESHQRESSEKEAQIQCLRAEIAKIEGVCAELRDKVSEEEERARALELKLRAVDDKNLSMAKEKVAELKDGVSLLKSCLGKFPDSLTDGEGENLTTTATHEEDQAEVWRTDLSKSCHDLGKSVSSDQNVSRDRKILKTKKDLGDVDSTILLLRREIETSLQSLKEVQVEMEKLREDNSLMSKSEQKTREDLNCHASQLLAMQETMNSFECQSQLKMEAANQRLLELQQIVLHACSHSHNIKQVLESEVDDAKLTAVQNAAEAACILSKFEEARDMIREADIMINGLVIENERMKLEVKKLKKTNRSLIQDKGILETQFENLSSVNNLKSQQCEKIASDLVETQGLVVELEGIVTEVQTAAKDNLTLLSSDFQAVKCQLFDSSKLVRTWLEDIWSEIVVKDCAVSVLHLCNMGVLLETITGLNAENGLLQNGMCESNAAIADLREHNSKSIKELEMCRVIKGKLLADIKSGFDRISKKEEDSQELMIKLTAFDKKILDLQSQEESMLQRSNYIGSQLALLIKELDLSNKNLEATLLDQEKVMESQVEFFTIKWCVKEFESLVLASELKEMALHRANAESMLVSCAAKLENIKKELVLSKIDSELKHQFSSEKEIEVSRQISFLDQKNQQLQRDVMELETRSDELVSELETKRTELIRMVGLEKETESLRIMIDQLNTENSLVLENLQAKNSDIETSSVRINVFEKENHLLKDELLALETRIASLQAVLEAKTSDFESALECKKTELTSSEKENKLLRIEIDQLKEEKSLVVQNLQAKNSDIKSSLGRVSVFESENHSLRDEVLALENRIASLQTVLDVKTSELCGIQESQLATTEELCLKSRELEAYGSGICALKEENHLLTEELGSLKTSIKKCLDSMDEKFVRSLNKDGCANADKMLQDITKTVAEKTQEFTDQLEQLKLCATELESENSSLRIELMRKDEVLEGLQFDLSLLQESASKTKDQKDEIEKMLTSLEALEDKLSANTIELEEVVAIRKNLETELSKRSERILALENELSKENGENSGLREKLEETLAQKSSIEDELVEAKKVNESLEAELLEIGNAIDRRNSSIDTLRSSVHELECERDELLEELAGLKDRLDSEQSRANELEAVAQEAQEMAESRNSFAVEKEAEVKLLERSVEELESTINVLEDKANFVQSEAERQRLLNEELELELFTVKQQLNKVQNNDSDMKRYLEENKKNLQELNKKIHGLEGQIGEKNSEIHQLKAHITELNLHAEAQASEYKLKFKALEAMAENVKPDTHFSNALNSSSPKKPEKFSARPRGSGSPFKCIGLGISQQIKSERCEEITAARQRIEELESLASSRQKEIFALNARLATAESMTHDVMRDLLGVKLDMTACASMADGQQVQEITEKIRLHNLESEEMEHEVFKLRKQLTEFIKERQGWLEEIDRKQAELIAAKVSIEKLRQNDQLFKTENEMLKMECVNHKQRLRELEGEVKKLSGHQNLHQRIHHHAKIKDENNMLKIRNEELSAKLRHSEAIVARVKEEIAFFRASAGKDTDFDFDEEKRLSTKLKETEEEKIQLAHKLLALCTGVLKVAGITKPVTEISPSDAEEALDQLNNTVTTMDRELEDLKYKNKIMSERMRLSELMPQNPVATSRVDENRQTPKRLSQPSYFSPLDR